MNNLQSNVIIIMRLIVYLALYYETIVNEGEMGSIYRKLIRFCLNNNKTLHVQLHFYFFCCYS